MSNRNVPTYTQTGDKWSEIGTGTYDERSGSIEVKVAKDAPVTVHGDRPADAASWPN